MPDAIKALEELADKERRGAITICTDIPTSDGNDLLSNMCEEAIASMFGKADESCALAVWGENGLFAKLAKSKHEFVRKAWNAMIDEFGGKNKELTTKCAPGLWKCRRNIPVEFVSIWGRAISVVLGVSWKKTGRKDAYLSGVCEL